MHDHDDAGQIFLSEGYLPDMDAILSAAPKNPRELRLKNLTFDGRDDAAAHVSNAIGRRMAYYRRFAYHRLAHTMPLSTWIVAPPRDGSGELAFWFRGEQQDSGYRLIVHGMPSRLGNREIPCLWHRVYENRHIPIRPRKIPYGPLKRKTIPFLKKWLEAYRHGGHEGADRFMNLIGHPIRSAFSVSADVIE